MAAERLFCAAVVAALALSSCGSGEMSLAEYVDRIDAIFERGIERYETVVNTEKGLVLIVGQSAHLGFEDQGAELTDFTPQDLHAALVQVAEIQEEALASAAAIDPPDLIADLHALYFRELPIAALAARAATAADWYELSESAEMAAYRDALAADNEVCAEFQAKLDAAAAAGAFTDAPWMPGRLTEIVDYALSCDDLPADPQNAYRPPPTAAPLTHAIGGGRR